MTTRLESLTINNFRCLKGAVTVPLNAPVVLIYGANGQGKTSLFAAIELALTGRIASLERFDPNYLKHVPWRDSVQCTVSIATDDGRVSKAVVSNQNVRPTSQFGKDEVRFFRERCLLPQSLLWRLLEEYQRRESRSDSPLTAFVKDLIGLDHLDAIVDGLHVNGDVRRLRTASSKFTETEQSHDQLVASVNELRRQLGARTLSRQASAKTIELSVERLGHVASVELDRQALIRELREASEHQQLEQLARTRRDVRALSDQWTSIADTAAAVEMANAELHAQANRTRLLEWQTGTGEPFRRVLETFKEFFQEFSYSVSGDPAGALKAAQTLARKEVGRISALLEQEAALEKELRDVSEGIEVGRKRVVAIDDQIAKIAADADDFAQALAQLLPHIHANVCPVCDRDFSETSRHTLLVHVSTKLSDIKGRSAKLRALSADRSESLTRLRQAEYRQSAASSRRADEGVKTELVTRRQSLVNVLTTLDAMEEKVSVGAGLSSQVADAERKLADLASRNQQVSILISSLQEIGDSLAPEKARDVSDVPRLIEELRSEIDKREGDLSKRLAVRSDTLKEIERLATLDEEIDSAQRELATVQAAQERAGRALDAATAVREMARTLAKRATETRSALVQSALNDRLNEIWRKLFIRLAPSEPYVPAFGKTLLPGAQVMLETRDRHGNQAGTPTAMLSAGNLNTAALTLFLALHLSVTPTLPWLLLDDPVQSMDEVHVSQFAALLRTLSKQHDRQVIIAVHERPLFDYLALELSPAFESDRLLTLELGRDADDAAAVHPREFAWSKDSAVA